MTRLALAVMALLAAGTFVHAADVQKNVVDIKAPDGINLKGTYFSSSDKKGPGVILFHQCNLTRTAWDKFATDLANQGFHVMTFDFRGYGDSEEHQEIPVMRNNLMQKWAGDEDAAYAYLLSQKGVDKSRIISGGASCGVSAATDFVIRHREVKTLITLSGQSPDEAFIARTPDLAIFGAAMDHDQTNPQSPQGVKDIIAASKNPHSEMHLLSGSAHGAPMFDVNPELESMLIVWLKTQEKMGPADPK